MGGWTLLCCVMLVCAGLLLWSDHRRRQHEQINKERMRGSMLYYEIYPLVAEAQKHPIDRVVVDRSRVTIHTVYPPGMLGEYALTATGHRPLNEDRTWALLQVIADDLPALRQARCYRLKRFRVTRPNGKKDWAYMIIIKNHYKAEVLCARQRKPRLY